MNPSLNRLCQLRRSFLISASYLNCLGSGIHAQPSVTETMTQWSVKKMTAHCATVRKGRVVTWLDVTTGHVPQSGFILHALDCLLCPMVNGTVQHVSLTLLQESEKQLVLFSSNDCL